MNCSKCGDRLTEGVVSCSKCGTPVASAVVAAASLSRPFLITLLAVYQFIGSVFVLVRGISLIANSPQTTLGTIAVCFLLAAMSVYGVICGIGLLRLRQYGRIMLIISFVVNLVSLIRFPINTFPIGAIMSILVLVYLFKPGMRVLFSGKEPEELSAEEIIQLESTKDVTSLNIFR